MSVALAARQDVTTGRVVLPGLALCLVVVCGLWVLVPIDLRYELGNDPLAEAIRATRSPAQAMERIAGFHDDNFQQNQKKLSGLHRIYFVGAIGLALELFLLALLDWIEDAGNSPGWF
jgi:hypothetical protein